MRTNDKVFCSDGVLLAMQVVISIWKVSNKKKKSSRTKEQQTAHKHKLKPQI